MSVDVASVEGGISQTAFAASAVERIWPLPDWLSKFEGVEDYEWAVLGWRRAAAVPDAWFDAKLADGIVMEWPEWARLTADRFAGMPFNLLPWQELIVRLLVGWMAPVEVMDPITHAETMVHCRLFRRLLLWIPRKNGKSEFLAALGLMFAGMDAIRNFEGYVFARDEEQGRTTLNRMKSIAAASPQLKDETLGFKNSLYFKNLAGSFQLLTGAESGKHGKMPSVIVGDEIHEWRSLEVPNTLRQGTGTRLEPIELYASTAGKKTNRVGVQVWDETRAILDGRVNDPTTLAVVFAAPPDCDYRDESAWAGPNPSLGLSPTKAYLRREAALCADNPRAEAAFRCFHLNQWVDESVRWLSLKKWDLCAGSKDGWKLYPETLKGRPCHLAMDVSSTKDLTCLVAVFEPTEDDPKWRLLCRFWCPEDTLALRIKQDRVPYDDFLRQKAMETTPGDFVDQNYVKKAILEAMEHFDVQLIGYDPWNANKLIADLQGEGIEPDRFVKIRQGVQTLGEPTKHFERLVYSGVLDHGGNPVLRWMARNAVVRFDENLNFMPAKKRSSEKIDGIVAGVMAVGLACSGEEAVDLDDFLKNAVMV